MTISPVLLTTPTSYEMSAFTSFIDEKRTLGLVCGIGPAATAFALTRFLERNPLRAVLLCGIGGRYPRSSLGIGDVALAESEIFADLGRCAKSGIEPLNLSDETPRIHFPLKEVALQVLGTVPSDISFVPMATVSCASGTTERADLIARNTGAWAEDMEGAAAALVCTEYGVPLIELRAISNVAGDPDRSNWRIDEALARAAEAARWILNFFTKK